MEGDNNTNAATLIRRPALVVLCGSLKPRAARVRTPMSSVTGYSTAAVCQPARRGVDVDNVNAIRIGTSTV